MSELSTYLPMFTQTYSSNVLPLDLVSVSPGEGFSYLPMPPIEPIWDLFEMG